MSALRPEIRWPAVVGALAAAASALVAFLTFVRPHGSAPPPSPAPTASSPAPRGSGGSGGSGQPSSAPGPAVSGQDVVRWHGLLRIPLEGVYLDQNPPKATDGANWDVAAGDSNTLLGDSLVNGQGIALWTAGGQPTRKQCADQVDTQGQQVLAVRVGSMVCVKTQQGRVALLVVKSIGSDYTDEADTTVWELN